MDTTDVDSSASADDLRGTLHVFVELDDFEMFAFGPDRRIRIPNSTGFPPTILFDAVYASAVLKHFGTQTMRHHVGNVWRDTLYPRGVMTAARAAQQAITDERIVAVERKRDQDEQREARYKACQPPDTFDMLMMLPYCMMPHDKVRRLLREAKEKAEEVERLRTEQKVSAWIRQMNSV